MLCDDSKREYSCCHPSDFRNRFRQDQQRNAPPSPHFPVMSGTEAAEVTHDITRWLSLGEYHPIYIHELSNISKTRHSVS